MKTFTIEVTGKSQTDIQNALEEVMSRIDDGMTFGFDCDEDGHFGFNSSGEYEVDEDDEDARTDRLRATFPDEYGDADD